MFLLKMGTREQLPPTPIRASFLCKSVCLKRFPSERLSPEPALSMKSESRSWREPWYPLSFLEVYRMNLLGGTSCKNEISCRLQYNCTAYLKFLLDKRHFLALVFHYSELHAHTRIHNAHLDNSFAKFLAMAMHKSNCGVTWVTLMPISLPVDQCLASEFLLTCFWIRMFFWKIFSPYHYPTQVKSNRLAHSWVCETFNAS